MQLRARKILFWIGAALALLGGTSSASAWSSSTLNVVNSAGANAGQLVISAGGIDFSQSILCPVNSNSSLAQGQLRGLEFFDTRGDQLPLDSASGNIYIDFDGYEDGGCDDPSLSSFTVTGPGFSIKVTPLDQYDAEDNWWGGTAVLTLNTPSQLPTTPVTGFIRPKYQVVGMYYAPPGSKSVAAYTQGFTNGTATSSATSYQNTESESVSITTGFSASIPIAKADFKLTATETGQWSQTTTDSQTITVSQTQTTVNQIPGPAASKNGIDHDEDIVWVWLNPEVSITLVQNIAVTTNGYFADPNDPVRGVDIVTLTVNQLKNPGLIPANVLSRLDRPWDPAGGPLVAADFLDILKTDPYVANPALNPVTDTTGRYSDTGVIINYEPTDGSGQATSTQYSVASSTATSNVQTRGDSHSTGFSIDTSTGGSVFGLNANFDFKAAYTYTTTNTASSTINSGRNQTAAVTIFSPLLSDGYAGPTAIKVYRDNVYGTFMFYGAE